MSNSGTHPSGASIDETPTLGLDNRAVHSEDDQQDKMATNKSPDDLERLPFQANTKSSCNKY